MLKLRNHLVFYLGVGSLVGCATTSHKEGPMRSLQIASTQGREELARVHFASHKFTYEGSELRHEQEEVVDFSTRTVTKLVAPNGEISFLVQTLSKDGPVDLHDLAFPEPGEVLELVLDKQARVLVAGLHPKDSIFFVPPVALPVEPIQIGDTWMLEHEWRSQKSGLPMKLELLSILKGWKACGHKDECAEIEVSGGVGMPPINGKLVPLQSEMKGLLLVSHREGIVIWSKVFSRDQMLLGQERIDVKTCMETVLDRPEEYRLQKVDLKKCAPGPLEVPSSPL